MMLILDLRFPILEFIILDTKTEHDTKKDCWDLILCSFSFCELLFLFGFLKSEFPLRSNRLIRWNDNK